MPTDLDLKARSQLQDVQTNISRRAGGGEESETTWNTPDPEAMWKIKHMLLLWENLTVWIASSGAVPTAPAEESPNVLLSLWVPLLLAKCKEEME